MNLRVLIPHRIAIKVIGEFFFICGSRSLDHVNLSAGDCFKRSRLAKIFVHLLLFFDFTILALSTNCFDRYVLISRWGRMCCGLVIRSLLLDTLQKLFGGLDLRINVHGEIVV